MPTERLPLVSEVNANFLRIEGAPCKHIPGCDDAFSCSSGRMLDEDRTEEENGRNMRL
jgi:hypothetical protein